MMAYWIATGKTAGISTARITEEAPPCCTCKRTSDNRAASFEAEYIASDDETHVEWFYMCLRCFVETHRKERLGLMG